METPEQTVIDSFTGIHAYLSNFFPCQVPSFDGLTYPSAEHAFQAAKCSNPEERQAIRLAPTAGQAKKMGRRVELRWDWDQTKLQVMTDVLICKFDANPRLADQLIATGDVKLVEGNTWNDTFWGVSRGVGQNHLGYSLMRIREILQRERLNA